MIKKAEEERYINERIRNLLLYKWKIKINFNINLQRKLEQSEGKTTKSSKDSIESTSKSKEAQIDKPVNILPNTTTTTTTTTTTEPNEKEGTQKGLETKALADSINEIEIEENSIVLIEDDINQLDNEGRIWVYWRTEGIQVDYGTIQKEF